MPISTNAPFNEFGQSQILRDIEQLYLALNGAGSGGPGDGQTQDQSAATSQDSGGLPDLSNLATISYVNQQIGNIPGVSLAYLYGTGTITPSSTSTNAAYSSVVGTLSGSLSGNVFTAPSDGLYILVSQLYTDFRNSGSGLVRFNSYTTCTAPYGTTTGSDESEYRVFTVGGVSPVYSVQQYAAEAKCIWVGVLSAGQTLTLVHSTGPYTDVFSALNRLYIGAISN